MVDYTKTSGYNGKLMIRDEGSNVEFWFKAGYSNDWHANLKFSYSANGSTTSKTIYYHTGADWRKIGERTVTKSQTVTFKLVTDTSISGIGGPTTFSKYLARDTTPSAPTTPVLSGVTSTTMNVKFSNGPNQGASEDSWEIAYGRYVEGTPDSQATDIDDIVPSNGNTTLTGLEPGRIYYVWARSHNSEGWGPWSNRASAKTLTIPVGPPSPLLSSVRATSVDVAFLANDSGGSPITAWQVGYSTSTGEPTTVVSATSPQVVEGLQPGTQYYFRVRAQSAVGWSAWSTPTIVRTVAGAYIKVGAVWKLAIPYVRVAGEWVPAEAWTRTTGIWKRNI